MKREVKIVIETERTIELTGAAISDENWCPQCRTYTRMLSLEMAAAIAGVSAGAINHWVESRELHCRKTGAGLSRICQESLFDHLRRLDFMPKSNDASRAAAKNRSDTQDDRETQIDKR